MAVAHHYFLTATVIPHLLTPYTNVDGKDQWVRYSASLLQDLVDLGKLCRGW